MNHEQFVNIWLTAQPPKPVFYRLYYGQHGEPLFYSMEDLPGNYIDIDAEFYARSPRNIRVRHGKIHIVDRNMPRKLVPSAQGTPCDPRDVCIVVSSNQSHTKWSTKTHEQD